MDWGKDRRLKGRMLTKLEAEASQVSQVSEPDKQETFHVSEDFMRDQGLG
jgi:hypothetical protein